MAFSDSAAVYKRPINTNKPPKKKEIEMLTVKKTVVSKILSIKVNFWDQRSDKAVAPPPKFSGFLPRLNTQSAIYHESLPSGLKG